MKNKTRKLFQRSGFFRIGALILIWLATAIASQAQTYQTLLNFDQTDDGVSGLVQGRDGNLYGTSTSGGQNGKGAVFEITRAGTLTVLYSFCSRAKCADGQSPGAGLVLATDGDFYGSTTYGGAKSSACQFDERCGTIFKITSAGKLTTLYSFCSQANCADGLFPSAGLVQATDGTFYGETMQGGTGGAGTVFKITSGGKLTTLYAFCSGKCGGIYPAFGLVQGADGSFYGITSGGGYSNHGSVFKITPTGKHALLHRFHWYDGHWPKAGLVQGTDGNLYGTTSSGGVGAYCCGTAFKITPAGKLTNMYKFGADGATPLAPLIQASDGNFYGTTSSSGTFGGGTIFEITPERTLTTLYNFCSQSNCSDGGGPRTGLVQATDGNFYGATSRGGAYGDGTAFSLSVGLSPFVILVRDSGKVGRKAGILGQGFTGSTGVTFNGTAAAFTVQSDTYLVATVPAGATTGPVTVATPTGALASSVPYRVRPTILSFSPTSGPVGTPVTITGDSLTQTTNVTFGGVQASFQVNSDTQVTATVPAGAQTGKIAIVTAGGKTWSTTDFTVTQ